MSWPRVATGNPKEKYVRATRNFKKALRNWLRQRMVESRLKLHELGGHKGGWKNLERMSQVHGVADIRDFQFVLNSTISAAHEEIFEMLATL